MAIFCAIAIFLNISSWIFFKKWYNGNMNTNEFIIRNLKCGDTRDNMLFENCPFNLMLLAGKNLSIAQNNCTSINIALNAGTEMKLEKLFASCETELQRIIFAECYVNSLIMLQIMKKFNVKETKFGTSIQEIQKGLNILEFGNFDDAKNYYTNAPMAFEVSKAIRKQQRAELNVFLFNTKNKYLQLAINKYLASREPYSIKVFTDSKLPTYYTHDGQFIQSPHDYLLYDLKGGSEKTF